MKIQRHDYHAESGGGRPANSRKAAQYFSPHQLSYVTHSGEGEGLLFFGNVILPFVDRFPTDLELYKIMTTKLGEVSEGAQK